MTRKDENNRPNNRGDIYTRITDQIIAALEQGIKPWTQPWNAAHAAGPISRPLRHNGQPYSGINVLSLWASSMERHFAAPIWMTFKQAHELGGHVRKGEKGSPIVFANTLTRTERDDATGEEVDQTIPFMKGYTVFNIEQIEGLPAHYYAPAKTQFNPDQRVAAADAFFADTGADRRHVSLAPAYDFVATVPYLPGDATNMKISRVKVFSAFSVDELTHLAVKASIPKKMAIDAAKETVQLFREHWEGYA